MLLSWIFFKGVKKHRKATVGLGVITLLFSSFAAVVSYLEFQEIVEIIESDQIQVVEGKVSNYKPLDLEDHSSVESFTINEIGFSYSDYHQLAGYHHACSLGGIICKNDQQVKLTYYTKKGINYIVRIAIVK